MRFRILILIFCFIFLPKEAFSKAGAERPTDWIAQGEVLFKKSKWNDSEKAYLRALKSPSVEDRIRAYEGLVLLYRKVKNLKKADRADASLAQEKKFRSLLVPEKEKFYWGYQVRSGDTYAKLSARYGVSQAWLMQANKNQKLIAGQKILIPKYHDTLIVHKTKKILEWKRGEYLLKIYPIAIGKKGTETPEGKYQVTNKVADPVWYHEKEVIAAQDSKNLLGTRWFGLNKKGYGIHGTRLPGTIREAASHGCIRMFNQDVEELFEWLPLGTPVLITK